MSHKARHDRKLSLVAILVSAAMICLGCSAESEPETPAQTSSQPVDQTTQQDSRLVGAWLGSASVDEAQFQAKWQAAGAEERVVLNRAVQNFMTTVVAMNFTSDGRVENEIEMSIDGAAPIRESSVGQWKIIDRSVDGVTIEVDEQLADGSISKSQKNIRFSEDGNLCELPAPIDIYGIGAKLVFERLETTSVAQQNQAGQQSR